MVQQPGPPRDRPKPKPRPTGPTPEDLAAIALHSASAWNAYADEHASDLNVNWIRQTAMEAFSAGYFAGLEVGG